jgi:hypothetical protein
MLKHWKYSLRTGYFNACDTSIVPWNISNWGIPQNKNGFEYSHSGKGYIGIATFGSFQSPNYKCYAIGSMNQVLESGKKYRIKMYVSLADSFITACHNLAIYFTDTLPTYTTSSYIINFNLTNNLPIQFNQNLSNKVGWTLLDTVFTASGYEKWLTIGNFKKDDESDTTFVGGNLPQTASWQWDYSAYYIDDVSVELVDETGLSSTNPNQSLAFKVMPNPCNGSFVLEGRYNNVLTVIIQNTAGAMLYNKNIQPQNKRVKIDDAALAQGIYFVKVTTEYGLQCLKLVVQ